jgi:uncharacterized membrane protein YfcA
MEIIEWILPMFAVGAAAGFVAGLAGIGGGMLLVPALYFIYQSMHLAHQGVMHLAIGTSLCVMIATSISAVTSHHRQGDIVWPIFWKVLPGLVVGVLAGALLAYFLPSRTLALIFGVILVVVSVTMLTGLATNSTRKDLPSRGVMAAAGAVIGFKSGLLGVGGGALSVPFLTWCGLPVAKISGTSSTFTFPVAVAGTVSFILSGVLSEVTVSWATGYVYWPAVVTVATGTVLLAPLGTKVSHHVAPQAMRIGFGIFLMLLGIRMVTV